jgi:hypothetical protein
MDRTYPYKKKGQLISLPYLEEVEGRREEGKKGARITPR